MKALFYGFCLLIGFITAMVLETILSLLPRKDP